MNGTRLEMGSISLSMFGTQRQSHVCSGNRKLHPRRSSRYRVMRLTPKGAHRTRVTTLAPAHAGGHALQSAPSSNRARARPTRTSKPFPMQYYVTLNGREFPLTLRESGAAGRWVLAGAQGTLDVEVVSPPEQGRPGLVLVDGSVYRVDRKSTRLNSSHSKQSRMPSSA